jgi:small-conductance mechanosensitive channel
LEPYNPLYAKEAQLINSATNNAAIKSLNQEMIQDFEKIFNEWSEKIEQALEEADADKKDDKEAGPR